MSEALAQQAADHYEMEETSLSLDELLEKINSNSEKSDQQIQRLQNQQVISETSTQTQVDAETQLKEAVQTVTIQIVGVLCIAVAVGAILGICCTKLIGNLCARSQKRRLEKAKAKAGMQFVD